MTLIQNLRNWNHRRIAAHELHNLSDRMLRDIGIDRSQIDFAVTERIRSTQIDAEPNTGSILDAVAAPVAALSLDAAAKG